jgi:hypothetical protein
MKAKKKPIEKLTADDLGVDLTPVLETIKVTEPPKRVGGGKVGDIFILYLFLSPIWQRTDCLCVCVLFYINVWWCCRCRAWQSWWTG